MIGVASLSDEELKTIEVGEGSVAPHDCGAAARRDAVPGLIWLGGFKSDMKGTKAQALDQWAKEQGRACIRFDYSGHGESGGDFADGTIGRWLEESCAVFESILRRTDHRHRLVDGRMDFAAACARICATGKLARRRRACRAWC